MRQLVFPRFPSSSSLDTHLVAIGRKGSAVNGQVADERTLHQHVALAIDLEYAQGLVQPCSEQGWRSRVELDILDHRLRHCLSVGVDDTRNVNYARPQFLAALGRHKTARRLQQGQRFWLVLKRLARAGRCPRFRPAGGTVDLGHPGSLRNERPRLSPWHVSPYLVKLLPQPRCILVAVELLAE